MLAKEMLKKYLENLIFELKDLKAILEIEIEELNKGITDILDFTNPRRDMLIESVINYHATINSWFKTQTSETKNLTYMIEEINNRLDEISLIYNIFERKLNELMKEKKNRRSKIKFTKNIFGEGRPILLDLKI